MIYFLIAIIIALVVGCFFLFSLYLTVKRENKHLEDTFQIRLLSKHIALNREIEALKDFRNAKMIQDFSELDRIIERLRNIQ